MNETGPGGPATLGILVTLFVFALGLGVVSVYQLFHS